MMRQTALRLLMLLAIVVWCSAFRFGHNGLLSKPRKFKTLPRHSTFGSIVVSGESSTMLRSQSIEEPTFYNAVSNSALMSFVREMYSQYGLLSLALPAAVAGAAWTYYVRKVLKNKPTIYECDKCGNQLRAPAGKSRLVLDRPGFRCPRCHSKTDSYFDINGWDFRAARRRAQLQVEEAARNKYVDMKEEKVRAAAEYSAMRAAAQAREAKNQAELGYPEESEDKTA